MAQDRDRQTTKNDAMIIGWWCWRVMLRRIMEIVHTVCIKCSRYSQPGLWVPILWPTSSHKYMVPVLEAVELYNSMSWETRSSKHHHCGFCVRVHRSWMQNRWQFFYAAVLLKLKWIIKSSWFLVMLLSSELIKHWDQVNYPHIENMITCVYIK